MANNKIPHPYFCVFMMLSACISCLQRLFRGCQSCLPPTFSSSSPGFLQKCGRGGGEIWEGESSQNLSLKTSSYTQHLTSRGSKNTADLSEKIENFYSHPWSINHYYLITSVCLFLLGNTFHWKFFLFLPKTAMLENNTKNWNNCIWLQISIMITKIIVNVLIFHILFLFTTSWLWTCGLRE